MINYIEFTLDTIRVSATAHDPLVYLLGTLLPNHVKIEDHGSVQYN